MEGQGCAGGLDQLDNDAQAIANFLHASFKQVSNTKLFANFAGIRRAALVRKLRDDVAKGGRRTPAECDGSVASARAPCTRRTRTFGLTDNLCTTL